MGLVLKGVNYDVGTDFAPGSPSREQLSDRQMAQELRAVRDDLHANAVTVYGTPVDRLMRAATIAAELGLSVWVQPRMVDAGQKTLAGRIRQVAERAEVLRARHGDVVLNVGCELSIFAKGIVPGRGYERRTTRLDSTTGRLLGRLFTRRLNRVLARLAAAARPVFHGRLTYSGGMWEAVDWRPFDVVSVNLYKLGESGDEYARRLDARSGGKPLVISEFGCAAYEGADRLGPLGHEVVDLSGPFPVVKPGLVRNEQVQADLLGGLLDLYERSRVHGAFVYEFIEPAYPTSPDPRRDLDLAGYGLVKVTYGEGGGYTWEPKAAFHTVAGRFGA